MKEWGSRSHDLVIEKFGFDSTRGTSLGLILPEYRTGLLSPVSPLPRITAPVFHDGKRYGLPKELVALAPLVDMAVEYELNTLGRVGKMKLGLSNFFVEQDQHPTNEGARPHRDPAPRVYSVATIDPIIIFESFFKLPVRSLSDDEITEEELLEAQIDNETAVYQPEAFEMIVNDNYAVHSTIPAKQSGRRVSATITSLD